MFIVVELDLKIVKYNNLFSTFADDSNNKGRNIFLYKVILNNSLELKQLKPLKPYNLHFTHSLNDPLVSFL